MDYQKLYHSLYKIRNFHASKQQYPELTPQHELQLPAIVNPPTYLSTREKAGLSICICFAILFIIAVIMGIKAGTQQAIVVIFSSPASPANPIPTQSILNPPSKSLGKLPSGPTSAPVVRPTTIALNPASTPCPGVNCNPWGYNFSPGNFIYQLPAGFCNYFACTPNLYKPHHLQTGYIIECVDGMYTQSSVVGACNRHGGIWRPLYAH